MNSLITASVLAMLAVSSVVPASASGRDRTCTDAPESNWQPIDVAEQAVQKLGYTITRSSSKRGCYEFHATKGGQRFELKVDPATSAIVRTEAK